MDKITVDLRANEIRNVDQAVELIAEVKLKYPNVNSVIVSRSQQTAIGGSDDELTTVRMHIARVTGNPTHKIGYDLYAIKNVEVEVE